MKKKLIKMIKRTKNAYVSFRSRKSYWKKLQKTNFDFKAINKCLL
jgi:hypothetical protein